MRTLAEIAFRVRQEASNLQLFLRPPREAPKLAGLPLPDRDRVAARLRGSEFEARLMPLAEQILARRIPLLGYEIRPQGEIRWRRDYVHDRETEALYFRTIPYLDFALAGDHKIIWELNRHQHLVALAQAGLLSGRAEFFDEIFAELDSWMAQNPLSRGINWASALEVAFRSLSWLWIHHLAGDRMPTPLAESWRLSLFHHGCFLERNLSVYFSPNTHLQGEALALDALGLAFGVDAWRKRGMALMRQMIRDHVDPDGAHFERSSYYHLYALDMFLFHAVLEPPDAEYLVVLKRMVRYLWALAGSGTLPLLGDDDGGRLFHPFGERSTFARATLAACAAFTGDTPWHGEPRDEEEVAAWWLDTPGAKRDPASRVSELFPHAGTATLVEGDTEIIAQVHAFAGVEKGDRLLCPRSGLADFARSGGRGQSGLSPFSTASFARGRAGHSHAHSLHFTLRHNGQDVLIDPGTYTYLADPLWRDRFRGTAMHNTVSIDGRDQADPSGPFAWSHPPVTEIVEWNPHPWRIHARCRYRGLTHTRKIYWADGAVWVLDDFSGTGRHTLDQFWHCAGRVEKDTGDAVRLPGGMRLIIGPGASLEIEEGGAYGWRSPVFGKKLPCPVVCVRLQAELPCRMAAVIDTRGDGEALLIEPSRLLLGTRTIGL